MKLIRFFLRYSRRVLILAVLAGVASGACNTALIAYVNASLKGGASPGAKAVAAFAALALLSALTRFGSEMLLTWLGQGALFDLRTRLSRQILGVPLAYLEHIGGPRLLATLTEDIPSITGALLAVPVICINAAVFLGGLIYLGWLSPLMLLIVLGLLAVGIAGYQLTVFKAMSRLLRARDAAGKLYEHFEALTEGTKELKMHRERRDDFLTNTLRATAHSYRRHNVEGMALYTAAASWGQSLIFLIMGTVVLLSRAYFGADAQVMTGFVIVLLYIISPLQVIMNTIPTVGRANVAVAKVEELGLALSSNAESVGDEPGEPEVGWLKLELAGVSHTYFREGDEEPFTLGPLDLTFHQGELVFIVGGNGSGKTTLAKLLAGLYLPEGGRIYLDGQPVDEGYVESYRRHFSAVFSDFYLFENFPGLTERTLDSKVGGYLERLHLARKVRFEEGRLSTVKLSQGQRKRLALLTAYLEDRPIYLFDEWAADQDPYFREVFYQQLLPELKARDKTVIVITHDDRYYHLADRLIKLEYGRVVSEVAPAAEVG